MWGFIILLQGIFIGQGNFGKNLLEIFSKATEINWLAFFGSKEHYGGLENIWTQIEFSDFVVIACPDPFHIDWLRFLFSNHYKGMIFCEKSPVVNLQQLEVLKKIDNERIYFNFPLTFTNFIVTDDAKKSINQLLKINWGHNFALKQNYLKNWRSKIDLVPYGIGTSLAIHFVHHALCLYGSPNNFEIIYSNISKTGTSPDTVKIRMSFKSQNQIQLICSYAIEPTQNLSINDREFFLFLNKENIKQKSDLNLKVDKFRANYMDGYQISTDPFIEGNVKSVNYFINCLKNNRSLKQDKSIIYRSLELLFS
jgi:hypothetical protein